jgi:hypothetical protein
VEFLIVIIYRINVAFSERLQAEMKNTFPGFGYSLLMTPRNLQAVFMPQAA